MCFVLCISINHVLSLLCTPLTCPSWAPDLEIKDMLCYVMLYQIPDQYVEAF